MEKFQCYNNESEHTRVCKAFNVLQTRACSHEKQSMSV